MKHPPFPTLMHKFAQGFLQNPIDAANRSAYLPFQIEPKSLETLRLSLEGASA
jgi:hypothetical protein